MLYGFRVRASQKVNFVAKIWTAFSCLLQINYNKFFCNPGIYHLVIIHWPHNYLYLSRHVMRITLIKMHPYRVSIWLITCTSPLTASTFCQVSPNPVAVPKPILLHLKWEVPNKHSDQNVFLREKRSKYSTDDLWPELYGIYLTNIPNEREIYELQVTQIAVHKVHRA